MANIQHLATPIRAQLASPVGAIDLAGILHPTPAVGGEPFDRAQRLIPALEGMDRGWYAATLYGAAISLALAVVAALGVGQRTRAAT